MQEFSEMPFDRPVPLRPLHRSAALQKSQTSRNDRGSNPRTIFCTKKPSPFSDGFLEKMVPRRGLGVAALQVLRTHA